eukprot:scaffold2857_cov121-Isochrysis_galbana.AAC.2
MCCTTTERDEPSAAGIRSNRCGTRGVRSLPGSRLHAAQCRRDHGRASSKACRRAHMRPPKDCAGQREHSLRAASEAAVACGGVE